VKSRRAAGEGQYKLNGKLANTIIKTYPQVSQFWTYDSVQFVKQPTFSRDYPPSKNLAADAIGGLDQLVAQPAVVC
jgi:hypothetical protein